MKTRIKEIIDSDGVSIYYPQYKFLGFWLYFRGFSEYGPAVFSDIAKCIKWLEYKPKVKTFYHRMK